MHSTNVRSFCICLEDRLALSFTAHLVPRFIVSKCELVTTRPADKGGIVVVLNTEYYHLKMLEHLNGPTYRRLERNPMNEFKSEIDNLLKVSLQSNWISNKEHAYQTNQHLGSIGC